ILLVADCQMSRAKSSIEQDGDSTSPQASRDEPQ
ncbi:unnamed protein product, partial [marine sediment metagenome]